MLKRSYYQSLIVDFLKTDQDKILGVLAAANHFSLEQTQKNSWVWQIVNLKAQLQGITTGKIFFEFSIPRMGKRVDVILNIEGIIFVLEYKVGEKRHEKYAQDQAMDYSLDLKNFHEGSHNRHIVPIAISTNAAKYNNKLLWCKDKIANPLLSNGTDIRDLIDAVLNDRKKGHSLKLPAGFSDTTQATFEGPNWENTGYKPTPTIVEAAQALYKGHSVEEISRSDAGLKNLTHTAECIDKIIGHSKANGRKSICFVTGVPGAGKTLAGLNISTRKFDETQEHAVFLSGNGPLVDVLREALARDQVEHSKNDGTAISKKGALQKVSAFIQNIHHFRDEGIKSDNPPLEHVVVFDEAQRAWNREETSKFMVRKKGVSGFNMSEPEFLISLMDRRKDWCTVVCLVGGGQEINTGEAGLTEWFEALKKRFSHWDIYHSGQLANKTYTWGQNLEAKLLGLNVSVKDALHLSISIRSYRAERLSEFIDAVVDGDGKRANAISESLTNYPLVITRNIDVAREWLRLNSRGTERIGLVASSGAIRLKPEGIMVRTKLDPVMWFLNGKEDVRSAYYLEDVATEFDIQGLELDWTCVCWDADLRRKSNDWNLYAFKGTKWQNVNDQFKQGYLINAYRVLLTRARQGMVIFVPNGDDRDDTRPPNFYNETYDFLISCGFKAI